MRSSTRRSTTTKWRSPTTETSGKVDGRHDRRQGKGVAGLAGDMTQGEWVVRTHLAVLVALVAVTAVVVMPAGAITNGDPDVDGHPYVGLMVAKNAAGVPLWQCSGTLMAPTVFMVAGHCV